MIDIIKITDSEFEMIRNLVYDNIGINLTEQKRSLVSGRLQKILREHKFNSFRQYYDYLLHEKTGNALIAFVDRISTNHTFFWREKGHFDFLVETVLPEITERLKSAGRNDLRVWCAACSSGEEVYTLAMLLREYFGLGINDWQVGILATDISREVISKAEKGVYSAKNVSYLPDNLQRKYFKRYETDSRIVRDRLKEMILFRRLNLMRADFPFRNQFTIVFCRNVMIYFDGPTKEALVSRLYDNIESGGYLFIGHSEALNRETCRFNYQGPAVYQKELSA